MNSELYFSINIFHKKDIDLKSQIIERNAVRAVIYQDNKMLLVYSEKNNEYKFPGGGMEKGENEYLALEREINEEVGAKLIKIKRKLGEIIEYNKSEKDGSKIFRMTSTYYEVEVLNILGNQKLDEYEKILNFKPQWISIEEAIIKNTNTIKNRKEEVSNWIERETIALLEMNKILKKNN